MKECELIKGGHTFGPLTLIAGALYSFIHSFIYFLEDKSISALVFSGLLEMENAFPSFS